MASFRLHSNQVKGESKQVVKNHKNRQLVTHTHKHLIVRSEKKDKQFRERERGTTSPARHSYSIQENRSD